MASRWSQRYSRIDPTAYIDRHFGRNPIVHPQRVLESIERERSMFERFNGWLADHVAAVVGTMLFFHALWLVIAGWALWQSVVEQNDGFDPFPYAFLFFLLGGIMQSLFVPTMLNVSNRDAERDRIKVEADHRALTRLNAVNEEQLRLLLALCEALDVRNEGTAKPPATSTNDGAPPPS